MTKFLREYRVEFAQRLNEHFSTYFFRQLHVLLIGIVLSILYFGYGKIVVDNTLMIFLCVMSIILVELTYFFTMGHAYRRPAIRFAFLVLWIVVMLFSMLLTFTRFPTDYLNKKLDELMDPIEPGDD